MKKMILSSKFLLNLTFGLSLILLIPSYSHQESGIKEIYATNLNEEEFKKNLEDLCNEFIDTKNNLSFNQFLDKLIDVLRIQESKNESCIDYIEDNFRDLAKNVDLKTVGKTNLGLKFFSLWYEMPSDAKDVFQKTIFKPYGITTYGGLPVGSFDKLINIFLKRLEYDK